MSDRLHIDYETFSTVDLKAVGAYRYAFSPQTEILCAAMALGEEEPVIWYPRMPDKELSKLDPYFDAIENPDVTLIAHHAMFEIAMSLALMKKTWGIDPPALNRWRCTMSLARRASLPASLDKLSEALNLQSPKDKRGKALIKKFSMMQPGKRISKKNPQGTPPYRLRPEDDPAAFAEFMAYCAQDVRAEQEVARRLAYFDEPINNANYTLDQIINARGVPVNLAALRHAQKLIDEETEIVSRQFRELVGLEVTQNAKILEWAQERGYDGKDLQVDTVEEFIEKAGNGSDPFTELGLVAQALSLRASISYAAIKKVATMLECAGPGDNRIRGMLNHHGATTGRWTASLVQMQNFRRSTIKWSEAAYQAICEGMELEMFRCCFGPPLEVIASCIRHFIHDV